MYSKQETALIKKTFWTNFGMYMRPVRSASGESVNWLNYKTGIRHIFFRLDAAKDTASVAIELRHTDAVERADWMQKFVSVKNIFETAAGQHWKWENDYTDADGKIISRITRSIDNVNIFNKHDWPAMISFLKSGIIALDQFWSETKDLFEN